jgi:gamma-glutamyltranspeptidase/glutathione hydrolase
MQRRSSITLNWLLAASQILIAAHAQCDERRADEPLYQHAAVAADHPLASEAGVEILKRGGNVVDAAVATAFALSVVRPASSGIGGGGFMIIWNAEKEEAIALDYRERAPQKAHARMFVGDNDAEDAGEASRIGHRAIAVPGDVAGLCYAWKHYGTLDLQAVLAPAIRLARDGVPIDEHARGVQRATLKAFADHPAYRDRFKTLYERYLNSGVLWKEGDRFHSPQLKVLELIAERGAEGFYTGEVADALLAESDRGGGLLTRADLAAVKPVVRRPLVGRIPRGVPSDARAAAAPRDNRDGGWRVLTMPPPSSGGVALLECLNILAAYEQAHPDQRLEKLGRNSAPYLHLLTETMKHAFADRAEFLGDADFVKVPVDRLISREYAHALEAKIDAGSTKAPEEYGRYLPANDGGTSHFSIIDARGNAVACTETINTTFGSYVVEPKFGIVLNNQMDDFAAVPGKPNAFGLIQSEANAVAPGKKPLSSMTPTIVLEDGKAVYSAGASGGPKIISATLQVLLNIGRFQMSPDEAIRQPRIHHQWLPNRLLVESPLLEQTQADLRGRGHTVEKAAQLAATQAVSRSPAGLRAAADPRKYGRAAGY